MKLLFVCRGNVCRSQMAMEYYNRVIENGADSAGTIVRVDGRTVGERTSASGTIEAMSEEGINIADNKSTQLLPEMTKLYNKIVVMAEPETVPEWLVANNKVEFWNVPDPKNLSVDRVRPIRNLVKENVARLVS